MFSSQRPPFTNVLVPLTLAALVVIGVCSALYLREADQVAQTSLERETRRMEIFAGQFQGDFASVISDLRLLATGDGLQAYLLSGSPVDLDRAQRRAIFFSKDNPDYDQVRYLDETGKEIIRLNWNGEIVPPDQLQNKGNRPYFQKTNVLDAGQIFVSAIDLNVENGVVQQPINPVVRLAMPVFDANNRRCGIYIINYRVENAIDRMRHFTLPIYQPRFRMLNDKGYWLASINPEEEWGFVLPGRSDKTLAKTAPGLWARIVAKPVGQEPYHGGYFTWRRFAPSTFATGKPVTLVPDDDFLVIGSELTAEEWAEQFASLRQTFVVVALILMMLAMITTWFFQKNRRAQQERDRFFSLTRDMLCVAGFDGYFKRVNPAWETALGYTRDEMVARPFLDFVHPDDRQKTIAATASLTKGGEVLSFENRYLCKDGSYRWLLWSARPLVEVGLIYASARDLTDRKQAEQNIQKLNGEMKQRATALESANKELESFSYSVSHDLRAPLRHIHGFVEMLQRAPGLEGDEHARHQMEVISRAAREMGRLIDDLLAFSRTGRAEMKKAPVDQRAMIDAIIADRALDIQGRQVTWEIQPLAKVLGDPGLLRLVWTNLIDNALKYSRKADVAKIEIGQATADQEAIHERQGIFYIRDNGVGFDMQYATKLFGVFQRLHRPEDFEGTGIGLANVQRIIHRHGGRIWAESHVDAGATFFFSLPLVEQPSGRI